MKITEFDIYRDLLKEKSGLALSNDKTYLLDSRLSPVAKKWGFESLSHMTEALNGVPDPALVNEIVEAMTTNETSFFRDTRPFDTFKAVVLPYITEARKTVRQIKIWSAAASSGQEPYSLAMILKEQQAGPMAGWSASILGTDISNDILQTAKDGIYSQFEVQRGLPITMLMSFFEQKDEKWALKSDIKSMVQFRVFNLLDSMTSMGMHDVIFCRNVLIYFDDAGKKDVLDRMASQLAPDGYLFLGGAETVLGITDAFEPVPGQRGLYVKAGSVHLSSPEEKASQQALA
jgi:chemotaxis protein methyltransferase CheR